MMTMEELLKENFQKKLDEWQNHVLARLVKYDEQRYAGFPHTNLNDLTVVYYISENRTNLFITNEMMKEMNTSLASLHKKALENTMRQNPPEIMSMYSVLAGMGFSSGEIESSSQKEGLYIITSKDKLNGAIGILSEETMQKLTDRIGGDFYVLPSSCHECIAVSIDVGNVEEVEAIIRAVNEQVVDRKDQLSDSAYYYSKSEHTLSLAKDRQKTMDLYKSREENKKNEVNENPPVNRRRRGR